MRRRHGLRFLTFWIGIGVLALPAGAITVHVDYDTYDTSDFFGSGNPQGAAAGAQARAALESAASFFTNILNDTFSVISVPPPYHSSVPGSTGTVTWSWQQQFQHPSTGGTVQITNATIPSDRYIIYAGARSLPGVTAGVGAVGGYGWNSDISGTNSFTQADINNIDQISNNFEAAVERRNEPSGFARWGGTIAFDTDPAPVWHFNHNTAPSGQVRDFYSVAIHELGHALGFGSQSGDSVTDWESLVSGSSFFGVNAQAKFGGSPVPLHSDLAHWANGTMSVVYGGTTAQETAMDPDILNGTRKRFTELDAAALLDIGWEVIPLPGVNGDYNNNGVVDAADYIVWRKRLGQSVTIPNDTTPGTVTPGDYTVWRANFGKVMGGGSGAVLAAVPEPAGALLASVGGIFVYLARRRPPLRGGARRG
jgi:hypothetical protein